MIIPGEAKVFGWLVVLALLAVAVPAVMWFDRGRVAGHIVVFCAVAASVLGYSAWRTRAGGLHEVRLEAREGGEVLVVDGPAVRLELRAPCSMQALRAEQVTQVGSRTVRMPLHVLIFREQGVPVLVLEEAVRAWSPGFAGSRPAQLAAGDAPRLVKSVVPADLERLRAAIEGSVDGEAARGSAS